MTKRTGREEDAHSMFQTRLGRGLFTSKDRFGEAWFNTMACSWLAMISSE